MKNLRIFTAFIASAIASYSVAGEGLADNRLDLSFEAEGSAELFSSQGGGVSSTPGALVFDFKEGDILCSPSLAGSRNGIYNPELRNRNTMFFVMENRSDANLARIYFITEDDQSYDFDKSEIFPISPGDKKAYYFNFSSNPKAAGRLTGFRVQPLDGNGSLVIDRITFEQEAAKELYAGYVFLCTATEDSVTVTGMIDPVYRSRFDKIALYETSMFLKEDDISKMEKLAEEDLSIGFNIRFPLHKGGMTRLSSQFFAVALKNDGTWMKISPRFHIQNWRDFEDNPYEFTLPEFSVEVTEYGAKGDGFTDDTDAIQAAIDDVSSRGGGRVALPGSSAPYGRRYVATNIMMRSNVELHIACGAILWQSQDERDYKYKPAYGHEGVIPGINWTHNMHVSNLPLIQGKSIENIKITGPGKIRSLDIESEDCDYAETNYERYCKDRIHVIPIGLWDVRNIEVSDLDIVRSNNYHTAFYACENVFIGNLKMHEVKCVSGDGIGLSIGTHDVKVVRCFLDSNDDGIVLGVSYNDPRGILWWWPKPDEDNSIRNVTVCHSYINSGVHTTIGAGHYWGGGKAIAFIPWGTDAPELWKFEIDSVFVYDCVLDGGWSVGTWGDNPYNGKVPFDNTETDDYSPIKNIRLYNNEYRSKCDLLSIRPTNFISDCGIYSSSVFQNGDFADGSAYWTMEGGANASVGQGSANGGRLYEGLYLKKGRYVFNADVKSQGELFIENAETGDTVKRNRFDNGDWKTVAVRFDIEHDGAYYLGISGKDARIKKAEVSEK